jgi:Tfp pilus assembly protein PilN
MLVEINLLPKKEPKKFGFIITISLIVFLILLASAFYYYQIHATKMKIQNVDKQLSVVRKISEQQSEKLNKNLTSNSVALLKNGVDWAEEYRIQTVPVLNHLTALLPERGFIQSIKYEESSVVELTVQFDTAREAAYYLDRLNSSKWIESSSVKSLKADNNNENPEGSTNSSDIPLDTGLNQPQNTVKQNVANSTTNTGQSAEQSNINAVPRYIGVFEIKLDTQMIKKLIKDIKKNENVGEGVTRP